MKKKPKTKNKTGEKGRWNVIFIGDYATITTTVDGFEDEAIVLAENMLNDYYDFDLSDWETELELIN